MTVRHASSCSTSPSRRLALRLTLAISAVVLAASAAFVVLALRAHETAMLDEVARGAALLSETLAASLHDDMLAARKDAAYRRLDAAAAAPGLARVRRTPSQVGLTREQRRDNVRGAFAVPEAQRARIDGR